MDSVKFTHPIVHSSAILSASGGRLYIAMGNMSTDFVIWLRISSCTLCSLDVVKVEFSPVQLFSDWCYSMCLCTGGVFVKQLWVITV